MLEKIFKILGVVGCIAIFIMSFIIPKNPFEIIQTPTSSYPYFLSIIIIGGILYLLILYGIYTLINKIYIKYLNRRNKVRVK